MAEESMNTEQKLIPADLKDTRDPRSYMSTSFQRGVDELLRGTPFDPSKDEDWKDGWSFAMKYAFIRNMYRILYGER